MDRWNELSTVELVSALQGTSRQVVEGIEEEDARRSIAVEFLRDRDEADAAVRARVTAEVTAKVTTEVTERDQVRQSMKAPLHPEQR